LLPNSESLTSQLAKMYSRKSQTNQLWCQWSLRWLVNLCWR